MLELPGLKEFISIGGHRWEEEAYSSVEPERQRCFRISVASVKEPEPGGKGGLKRVYLCDVGTYQILLSDAISPYPEAWYTPGVVSSM